MGGCQRRGDRDICGVIPKHSDSSDMPGGGVPTTDAQNGPALRTFNVKSLEGQDQDYAVGNIDIPEM